MGKTSKHLLLGLRGAASYTRRPVKSSIRFLISCISVLPLGASFAAEDASIDRLLSKLPRPEKLIKPSVQKTLEQPDPAFKDSLVTEIAAAIVARNYTLALGLSRKLTERYPRSAGAQCLRGIVAYDARQDAEASAAFKMATVIEPKFTLAYFGIAAAEIAQGHCDLAITHLRRVIELEPKAAVAYYGLSDCELRLGRKQQSAQDARKAAALDPLDPYIWLQLAKAENALGHNEATLNAIAKTAALSPDSGEIFASLGFGYINLNRVPQAIRRCNALQNCCRKTIWCSRSWGTAC